MHIWQGLESIRTPFGASSIAIGAFDGVHLGHQALITEAVRDARAGLRRAVVLTFDRHPAEVIAPSRAPAYLSTPGQRADAIASLGTDDLVIARFDDALRGMAADAFIDDVLRSPLGARTVVVGEDFRFGRRHAGTVDLLRRRAQQGGFGVCVVPAVSAGGEKVSSSRIRALLRQGDVARANQMLGRPYTLTGHIVAGEGLGRRLGFPTANVGLDFRQVVPADGVYEARASHGGAGYAAALSIGSRPTVSGHGLVIEAYLLGYDGDLYGQRLDIAIARRLREQRRFATLDALIVQMRADVEQIARSGEG